MLTHFNCLLGVFMNIIDTTTSLLECKSLELSLLELIKTKLTDNSRIAVLNNKEIMQELGIDDEQSSIFLKNYNSLLGMCFKVFSNDGMAVINLFEMINCTSVFLPVDSGGDNTVPVATEKTDSYEYCLTKHGAAMLKGTDLTAIDDLNRLDLSVHAKKLFMLVQQQNPAVVTIEQIRNILDIESTYKNLTNFKGLIKKSADQIIEQTQQPFEYGFLEFDGTLLGMVLQITNSNSIDLTKQWNYEEITRYINNKKTPSSISKLSYKDESVTVDSETPPQIDTDIVDDAPHHIINIPMINDEQDDSDTTTQDVDNIIDNDDAFLDALDETPSQSTETEEATMQNHTQGYTSQYDYHPTGLFINPINPTKDEDLVEIDLVPLSNDEMANLFDKKLPERSKDITQEVVEHNVVDSHQTNLIDYDNMPTELVAIDECNDEQSIINQFFNDDTSETPPADRYYDYNQKDYAPAIEVSPMHTLDDVYMETLMSGNMVQPPHIESAPQLTDDGSIMFLDETKQQEIDEINSFYYQHCQTAGIEHTQHKRLVTDTQLQEEATIWEMIQNSMQ